MNQNEQPTPKLSGKSVKANDFAKEHRKRMRHKVLQAGASTLTDLEILEMALYSAMPRADNEPVVKRLLQRFETIGGVVNAPAHDLMEIPKVGETVTANLYVLAEISARIAKDLIINQPILDNWPAVERFCISKLGYSKVEMFMVLLLDNQNKLIKEIILSKGTTDRTAIYPKELIKITVQSNASSVIIVHNHPSHDTRASAADIQVTKQLKNALDTIHVRLHDHLIVAGTDIVSFKALGLL